MGFYVPRGLSKCSKVNVDASTRSTSSTVVGSLALLGELNSCATICAQKMELVKASAACEVLYHGVCAVRESNNHEPRTNSRTGHPSRITTKSTFESCLSLMSLPVVSKPSYPFIRTECESGTEIDTGAPLLQMNHRISIGIVLYTGAKTRLIGCSEEQ